MRRFHIVCAALAALAVSGIHADDELEDLEYELEIAEIIENRNKWPLCDDKFPSASAPAAIKAFENSQRFAFKKAREPYGEGFSDLILLFEKSLKCRATESEFGDNGSNLGDLNQLTFVLESSDIRYCGIDDSRTKRLTWKFSERANQLCKEHDECYLVTCVGNFAGGNDCKFNPYALADSDVRICDTAMTEACAEWEQDDSITIPEKILCGAINWLLDPTTDRNQDRLLTAIDPEFCPQYDCGPEMECEVSEDQMSSMCVMEEPEPEFDYGVYKIEFVFGGPGAFDGNLQNSGVGYSDRCGLEVEDNWPIVVCGGEDGWIAKQFEACITDDDITQTLQLDGSGILRYVWTYTEDIVSGENFEPIGNLEQEIQLDLDKYIAGQKDTSVPYWSVTYSETIKDPATGEAICGYDLVRMEFWCLREMLNNSGNDAQSVVTFDGFPVFQLDSTDPILLEERSWLEEVPTYCTQSIDYFGEFYPR